MRRLLRLFIFVDPGGCQAAHFEWTLDGVPVGTNKPDLKLDFPQAGDFRLCVSATVGNPHNGAICLEQGPVCTTVKVRRHADRNGTLRTLCSETAAAGTYRWHSQLIQTSGIYRETFTDAVCCPYDSVVEFRVLPKPEPPDVYYITCNNVPYVDAMGRRWSPCRTQEIIDFSKFTEPYKCDSSIRLTAVNVDIGADWKAACMNGKVELNPKIKIVKPCEAGESYEYEYKWYRKTDTLKKTLSTDERLLVDSVQFQYCVDVQVKVRLGTAIAMCNKTFCDTINKIKALGSQDSIRLRHCDSVTINNKTYTQSDTFTQLWTNVFGCDSLVFTELNISKSSSSSVQQMECDSVNINGQSYYQSGTYMQTLQNANQCDSIIKLDLIIEKSSQKIINLNECDSVEFNGQIYYQSGNYRQQFFTSLGCDSILNLEINIAKSSKTDVLLSGCDSIMINGTNYKQSATFTQHLKNQVGCDSIIATELVIHKSSSTDLRISSCDSIKVNNELYTNTGDYTN
ncbi:MAG: hypothetical protein IPM92_16730 [Saprospiraceae bacterium]|nr:hypothetical protein [Saprospiraceae bacterium]